MQPNPSDCSTGNAYPTFVARDRLQLVDIAVVHNQSARAKQLLATNMNSEQNTELASIIDYLSCASTQAVDDLKSYQIQHLQALSVGHPNSSQLEAAPKSAATRKNTKKRSAAEMEGTELKMDDLPELPFEAILRYLTLEDRIKCRAVSRGWRKKFDGYPVKSLFYSERQVEFNYGSSQTIDGEFARNFISSTRFTPFFNAFGSSILSSLKHLRLRDLRLITETGTTLARTLNSFDQLEELGLFRFNDYDGPNLKVELNLNLPQLNRVHFEDLSGIQKLTLDAPKLRKIKLLHCSPYLTLDIVHVEPVETLIINNSRHMRVKSLKSLKYLYCNFLTDSTLLSGLEQLKELHLSNYKVSLSELFEQKERHGRADLKIYFCGVLVNRPNDWPAMTLSNAFNDKMIAHMAANQARLADEMPIWDLLDYTALERVAPAFETDLLNRLSDLKGVLLSRSKVQDIERFLSALKKFSNIVELIIGDAQDQELFDRLPDYCAVQVLFLCCPVEDTGFLLRLKHLVRLDLDCSCNADFIRKLFKLPLLSSFECWFDHINNRIELKLDHLKRFNVSVAWGLRKATVADLNAAIEFMERKDQELDTVTRLKQQRGPFQ